MSRPTQSGNLSFQLPDLLALTKSFPFRANKHCKSATDASESWFLNAAEKVSGSESQSPRSQSVPPVLDSTEREMLRSMKLITDFFALVFISHMRIIDAEFQQFDAHASLDDPAKDGFELLELHPLLRSLTPPLSRTISLLPIEKQKLWQKRFAHSVKAFTRVHLQVQTNIRDGTFPSLNEYISLRREIYASSMFFDLMELLEICPRPKSKDPNEREHIKKLTRCAVDIVAWSLDIFAFASMSTGTLSGSKRNTHNLVSLLTRYKNLSVQGAMNFAGGMVKDALEEFQQLEQGLLTLHDDQEGAGWAWLRTIQSLAGLGGAPASHQASQFLVDEPAEHQFLEDEPEEEGDEARSETQRKADVVRYVQALKDYILGSIHWGYETEMYFGQKGDEVRSFGWVFLNSSKPDSS